MKKSLREEQMLICSVLENLAGAQKCTIKKKNTLISTPSALFIKRRIIGP